MSLYSVKRLLDLKEKTKMTGDLIPAQRELPEVPKDWEYESSISRFKNLYKAVRAKGAAAIIEVAMAHKALTEKTKRKGSAKYGGKTFADWCNEAEITERTARRWFERYLPEYYNQIKQISFDRTNVPSKQAEPEVSQEQLKAIDKAFPIEEEMETVGGKDFNEDYLKNKREEAGLDKEDEQEKKDWDFRPVKTENFNDHGMPGDVGSLYAEFASSIMLSKEHFPKAWIKPFMGYRLYDKKPDEYATKIKEMVPPNLGKALDLGIAGLPPPLKEEPEVIEQDEGPEEIEQEEDPEAIEDF